MGGRASKGSGAAATKANGGALGSAGKQDKPKKNLNPADFIISKKHNEVITKQEGSIDCEQFNIEECKNCDIFLLDVIATSFVDECENCRIFMGPIETSVMVRNCRSCEFIIACQQFRSRDCADCRFSLLCTTEPIIETSSNMQFACFQFNYFSLGQQLQRSRLNVWNNKWWQVYDFNKNADRPNWRLFPQEDVPKMLRPELCSAIVAEELEMDPVVPISLGSRPWPSEESAFVVFLPDSEAYIEAFMALVAKTGTWALARARHTALPEDRLKALLGWAKEPKLIGRLKGKFLTGIEACGDGIFAEVQSALNTTGLAAGSKNIRLVPQAETQALARAFFETWKDEI